MIKNTSLETNLISSFDGFLKSWEKQISDISKICLKLAKHKQAFHRPESHWMFVNCSVYSATLHIQPQHTQLARDDNSHKSRTFSTKSVENLTNKTQLWPTHNACHSQRAWIAIVADNTMIMWHKLFLALSWCTNRCDCLKCVFFYYQLL